MGKKEGREGVRRMGERREGMGKKEGREVYGKEITN